MDEPKTCQTCKHFIQYYYQFGKGFRPLDFGHCKHPRFKDRRVETPACQRYSMKK